MHTVFFSPHYDVTSAHIQYVYSGVVCEKILLKKKNNTFFSFRSPPAMVALISGSVHSLLSGHTASSGLTISAIRTRRPRKKQIKINNIPEIVWKYFRDNYNGNFQVYNTDTGRFRIPYRNEKRTLCRTHIRVHTHVRFLFHRRLIRPTQHGPKTLTHNFKRIYFGVVIFFFFFLDISNRLSI